MIAAAHASRTLGHLHTGDYLALAAVIAACTVLWLLDTRRPRP